MPDNPTTPRDAFREGYLKARNDAVDRCRIELRNGDIPGNAAIMRCIAAIEALASRHAMNARLAAIVRKEINDE